MFEPEIIRSRKKTFNLNFGPKHPSVHGVLRLLLKLNNQSVKKTISPIELLQHGSEKLRVVHNTYLRVLRYFDRLDYVSRKTHKHFHCCFLFFEWPLFFNGFFLTILFILFLLSSMYLLYFFFKRFSVFKRPLLKAFLFFWKSGNFSEEEFEAEIKNFLEKETERVFKMADELCKETNVSRCESLWLRQKFFSSELPLIRQKVISRIVEEQQSWSNEKIQWYNNSPFHEDSFGFFVRRLMKLPCKLLNSDQQRIEKILKFLDTYRNQIEHEMLKKDTIFIDSITKEAERFCFPVKTFLIDIWNCIAQFFVGNLQYICWSFCFGVLLIVFYSLFILYTTFKEDLINLRNPGARKKLYWPFFSTFVIEILEYQKYQQEFYPHKPSLGVRIYVFFLLFIFSILFILRLYYWGK